MIERNTYAPADAKTVLSWINDEKTMKMWSRNAFSSFPITEDDLNSYYLAKAEEGSFFPMSFFEDGALIGHALMTLDCDVARLGFIIIDPELRGKGIGKKIVSLALEFAFCQSNVNEATLYVYDKNASAYNCYVKLGFKQTPRENDLRFDFFDDEWLFRLMKITKKEYLVSKLN